MKAGQQKNVDRQKELLNRLVNDSCSMLPENERGIDMVSIEGLMWNLFKGNYSFSLNDVRFIIRSKNLDDLNNEPL